MKRMKRFMCGALASLMLVTVPVGGFAKVQAAEVVIGVTSWEILQAILLSLGVTVTVQSSSLTSEICEEIVDTFNLWVQQNGFDDTAQLKKDLTKLLVDGKDNVVNVAEDTWSALRSWTKDIVNGKTEIKNPSGTTGDVVMSYNMLNSCSYSITASHGKDGVVQVTGAFDFYNISASRYGAIGCKVNNSSGTMLLFSDEAFTCDYLVTRDSVWLKYPSNFSPGVEAPWNADDITAHASSREFTLYGNEPVYYITLGMPAITDTYISGLPVYEGAKGYSSSQVVDQALRKCFDEKGHLAIKEYATDVIVEPVPFGGEAVSSGAWDVISKGRTWDGEAVSGDVNIAIPEDIASDIINVKEGTTTVSDVISIDDTVAIPVDTTLDKAVDYPMDVSETLDYADTKVGDIATDTDISAPDYDGIEDSESSGKYYVKGLQSVFPFCIPFDVIAFMGCLSAPAQAPHFKVPIKYPTLDGMKTYEVDLDLSKFNDVAKIVRVCETLLFCVGLAVATRNLYIRG